MDDVTVPLGRVELADGSTVDLPDDELMRIAYAMCTLALTPVIDHAQVTQIVRASGEVLWSHPSGR